jgi:hypothetical protein
MPESMKGSQGQSLYGFSRLRRYISRITANRLSGKLRHLLISFGSRIITEIPNSSLPFLPTHAQNLQFCGVAAAAGPAVFNGGAK